MQRLCTKLRSISLRSNRNLSSIGAPHRLIHHSPTSQLTLGFATPTPSKWSFLPATSLAGASPFVPHHVSRILLLTGTQPI